jgi:hypothetical protein
LDRQAFILGTSQPHLGGEAGTLVGIAGEGHTRDGFEDGGLTRRLIADDDDLWQADVLKPRETELIDQIEQRLLLAAEVPGIEDLSEGRCTVVTLAVGKKAELEERQTMVPFFTLPAQMYSVVYLDGNEHKKGGNGH